MIVRQISILAGTAGLITTTGYGDPLIIENMVGGGTLYIGQDDTVTNADGFLVSSALPPLNLNEYEGQVWGYALGGVCDIRLIENILG